MRNFLMALACGVVILGAVGCSRHEGTEGGKSGALTIAVIPKGTTHEYWKSVHAGALKAAKELGVNIIWKGPMKEDDREAQIRVVEDFVNSGVNGICVAPLDDVALKEPIISAENQHIPVLIFDSALKSKDYVSFVATNNYKGGVIAGNEMARLLGDKGKIIVLRYEEGSASTFDREKGFLDTIARFPGIQVVSSNQYGGATRDTALRASENLIAPLKLPGRKLSIDGIFTPNESTTFGMLRALQDAKLAGGVKFVGFDSADELVAGLKAGQINALVVQDPVRMGYLSIKTMVAFLHDQKVPKRIDTGAHLITQANMNNPDMHALIYPQLAN